MENTKNIRNGLRRWAITGGLTAALLLGGCGSSAESTKAATAPAMATDNYVTMENQSYAAEEAAEALTALGYSRAEAVKAVRACKENAQKEQKELADTESILKAALRYL